MSQPQPEPQSPLDTARFLAGALNGLSARLDAVKKASEDAKKASEERDHKIERAAHRSRIAIGVDILLTIILALGAWQFQRVNERGDAAAAQIAAANAAVKAEHASLIAGCEAGNENRREQLSIWDYLLAATTPTSPQQAAALEKFGKKVATTFEPRDCATAYSLTPAKEKANG